MLYGYIILATMSLLASIHEMTKNVKKASEELTLFIFLCWLPRLNVSEHRWCVDSAAQTACDCLVMFAVDPQDEAERRGQHLAVIADHLGFSWTGTPHP